MANLQKKYETVKKLQTLGWPLDLLGRLVRSDDLDYRVGSPLFMDYWQASYHEVKGKILLRNLLDLIGMPSELTGDLKETQRLLRAFHPSLSPDSDFWTQLAALVNRTFPNRTLGKEGDLERRLHQFRYLISSQQAQYVRDHYKDHIQTDSQALADYLRHKKGPAFWRKSVDYSLSESARLHNKLKIEDDQILFPDNRVSYNIKLLMGFHTEFILDSKGHFLNECDAEKISENGVVNGASFNYGTAGKRHWDLDVDPIRKHDPAFRRKIGRGYHSPKHIAKKWYQGQMDEFDLSYFNRKGAFGRRGLSSYGHVKRNSLYFRWHIRFLKWLKLLGIK